MKKTIQTLLILITFSFSLVAQTVDLKRGLIAYYPFNGNANDESGNGNNGTVYGASLTTDRNGKTNSAYSFNGNSSGILINNFFQSINLEDVSYSAWICSSQYYNYVSGSAFTILLGTQGRGGKGFSEMIGKPDFGSSDYKNKFQYYVYSASNKQESCIVTQSFERNTWYLITTVKQNRTMKVYINGRLSSTYSLNNNSSRINNLSIGAHIYDDKSGRWYYYGAIDDVRIYSRALNKNEIQALYSSQEEIVEKPVITFNYPNSTYSTVNQPNYNLNACIKSSVTLRNYSIYVNGNISRGFNVVSNSNCDFKIETIINLQEGNNTIKIIAENSGGSTTSSTYTINYVKPIMDNNPPLITITNPNVSRGFKPVEQDKKVTITGKATDASGIFEILINGEPASVDAQGNFSKTVLLAFGDNSFTIKATDIKQNTATETFTVERKSNQQDVVNNQTNNSGNLQTGKYYALIIGNNQYNDPAITSLDEPINDATKLYNVLTTKYTFEPQNVTFIKNASYVQMIEAFDNLSNKITQNDNLLVFYAGHGWWDDKKELGYWLPTDAKQRSTAFWIANSRISDYMSSIDTKHTLLIADACFSGSIFKSRSAFADAGQAINSLYKLPSRTAMTSGNLKEVPDKSVFLEYLVKRLDNNTEKYLSADQLFVSFRIAVMNNSTTEPQFGTIQNAGDEGGEFIFIRK